MPMSEIRVFELGAYCTSEHEEIQKVRIRLTPDELARFWRLCFTAKSHEMLFAADRVDFEFLSDDSSITDDGSVIAENEVVEIYPDQTIYFKAKFIHSDYRCISEYCTLPKLAELFAKARDKEPTCNAPMV